MSRKAANTLKPKGNVSVNDQWAETIRRTETCEQVTQVAVSFDDLQLDLTGRECLETRLWLDKVKGLIMNLNKTSTELVGRCSMKVCLFFKITIMFVNQGFKNVCQVQNYFWQSLTRFQSHQQSWYWPVCGHFCTFVQFTPSTLQLP